MEKIDAPKVQQLLNDIDSFEKSITTAGDDKRNKLKDFDLDAVRLGGPFTRKKFNQLKWSKLSEDEQKQFYTRLFALKEALQTIEGMDGPKDEKHIMSSAYVSTKAIILLATVSFSIALLIMFYIVRNWERATGVEYSSKVESSINLLDHMDTLKQKLLEVSAQKENLRASFEHNDSTRPGYDNLKQAFLANIDSLDNKGSLYSDQQNAIKKELSNELISLVKSFRKGGADEATILTMVIFFGMLGGMLHLIRSLVMFVGNRKLRRSWVLYYLSMPITGGGLAVIVYILLRIGLLNPSGAAMSSTTNLNIVAVYAFAGLTGLFARTALDKLSEVFKTMFQTESSTKDPLGTEKPPDKKQN